MRRNVLFLLWGIGFILCATAGFIPGAEGFAYVALVLLAVASFIPAGLLLSTREKVEEISFRCGFQDVSYFIKSFKGQEGCTPAEYRQRGGA